MTRTAIEDILKVAAVEMTKELEQMFQNIKNRIGSEDPKGWAEDHLYEIVQLLGDSIDSVWYSVSAGVKKVLPDGLERDRLFQAIGYATKASRECYARRFAHDIHDAVEDYQLAMNAGVEVLNQYIERLA